MTFRERFEATMHYKPVDRCPMVDFGFWEETLQQWHGQGLPKEVDDNPKASRYFGMDGVWIGTEATDLYPLFEYRVIEDDGELLIYRDEAGVTCKVSKTSRSIPMYLDWTLKDRESWEKHFKWRYDPQNPQRQKAIKQCIERLRQCGEDEIPVLTIPRLYGQLRNFMGVENISMLVYDDPGLFEEMVDTVAQCGLAVMQQYLDSGIRFYAGAGWEDMCYNAGPLLSPRHFKQYLVPNYRRVADLCHKYGIDVIWVDCDGNIEALMPLWLEAGINGMFPVEIGTWGADPIKYRKQYGKDLLMMGGFDKHILATTPEKIEAEIHRLAPLVEEGAFIPHCDHRVPPDVSMSNYVFYVEKAKEVWGKNIDTKPTPKAAAD